MYTCGGDTSCIPVPCRWHLMNDRPWAKHIFFLKVFHRKRTEIFQLLVCSVVWVIGLALPDQKKNTTSIESVCPHDISSFWCPSSLLQLSLAAPARLPGFHVTVGSGGERQPPEWYPANGYILCYIFLCFESLELICWIQ